MKQMNLVLLTAPPSSLSKSMPRFAKLIGEGMKARGHQVEYMTSGDLCTARSAILPRRLRKWSGYADQYLLFPSVLRKKVATASQGTLFVLTDQGLGMWLPAIARKAHVVHCHDLLAIRSATGEFLENPLSITGKIYQRLILRGLLCGRNFISVSAATGISLHALPGIRTAISEVLPNPLNRPIHQLPYSEACQILGLADLPTDKRPIIHVGGNQWYKNRLGVLEIYQAYAVSRPDPRPLWMVGPEPTPAMRRIGESPACKRRVIFLQGVDDRQLEAIYSVAWTLLFPSLEEGFGWPVLEAMAASCPVVTTGIPPMTEVMGTVDFQIPRKMMGSNLMEWSMRCAKVLGCAVDLSEADRDNLTAMGMARAQNFNKEEYLNRCEEIYSHILNREQ